MKNQSNIIDPKAASFVLETAEEIGRGANRERSGIVAGGTIKNVAIVVSILGTLGAVSTTALASGIPAVIVASGVSAYLVGEGLKKSKPFAALTGLIAKGLDKASDAEIASALSALGERFKPKLEFVLRIGPQLRQLASQREFSWLTRTLDWLKVHELSVTDRDAPETENPLPLGALDEHLDKLGYRRAAPADPLASESFYHWIKDGAPAITMAKPQFQAKGYYNQLVYDIHDIQDMLERLGLPPITRQFM